MATLAEALAIALEHHRAGRLQVAETIYRRVLEADPNQADAWHLLGLMMHQVGQHAAAVEHLQRAIRLQGDVAHFHYSLANVHHTLGQVSEAVACYRRALALKPDFPEAHNNLGNALKDLGQFDEAVVCYRRALELFPAFAEAYCNLAVVLHHQGKLDEAAAGCRRALELRPNFAEAHNNLGNVLRDQHAWDEAADCFRRALQLNPNYAAAHHNLGVVLKDQGRLADAVACFGRALDLEPNYAEAHNNLGIALKDLGKLDEAAACYRRAIQFRPDFAEACNNLGLVYYEQTLLDEAVAWYRRALELKPDQAEVHHHLGLTLRAQGKQEEAVDCYRRALTLRPDLAEALRSLGNALQEQGQPDAAIACYRRALELRPDDAESHNNLGNALKDRGDLDEAAACYRRALDLKPEFVVAHSNLVYLLHYCPGYDAAAILAANREWHRVHAAEFQNASPLTPSPSPARGEGSKQAGSGLAQPGRFSSNERAGDRRLRIGYVSSSFREHPLPLIAEPLFAAHDHGSFEIYDYSDVARPDATTARLRTFADQWRDIHRLNDAQLAELVRQDGVDILVDLGMHMGHNRLLAFARRPAPVQVTWCAYPSTTGLTAIDYRLTDPYLDPPGENDRNYTEQSVRLPDSYWCYDPHATEPQVNRLAALDRGYVTFGCLNNFCKVNERVLRRWAEILRAVNRARLMLLAPEGAARQRVLDVFRSQGIAPERIELVGQRPRARYLELYQQMDLGLDTFPYNGHTTSLDSLWMGVPVVSLVGATGVGRGGLSILSNLGLADLAACDATEYVRIAAALAGDLPRLAELRATLRQRLQDSPLMDGPRFARNVEAAYREMWRGSRGEW
jgi:predicted O-linked N-acetylglucosamine transferase (SPINDLY family)